MLFFVENIINKRLYDNNYFLTSRFGKKQLAALIGVAPYNIDSGKLHGKRFIFGDRKIVRKALYMTVVSSLRHSQKMLVFYKRLKDKDEPSKVI